jgi:hypothetical protein
VGQVRTFAIVGAVSGVISNIAFTVKGVSDDFIPGFSIAGVCVGLGAFETCAGPPPIVFLFPGIVFGIAISAVLWRRGILSAVRALYLIGGTTIAHTIAVYIALTLMEPLRTNNESIEGYVVMAIAGGIAGAVGGGGLALVAAALLPLHKWWRLAAVGSACGLLFPLIVVQELSIFDFDVSPGAIIFYAVWQAGYAAVLAASVRAQAA